MSNLIPEQRLDRNGKLVTRHVRGEAAMTNPRRAVAPLKLSGQPTIEALRNDLAEALQLPANDLARSLTDPDRLKSLISLTRAHDISVAATDLINGISGISNEIAFNECIGLLDRNFDTADATLDTAVSNRLEMRGYAPMLVTSMNLYEFDMTPAEESVLIEATCRIWMHDVLDEDSYMSEVFPSRPRPDRNQSKSIGSAALRDDLAHYIATNQDKVDPIIDMVTERKISDPKVIQTMLDSSSATALGTGVL